MFIQKLCLYKKYVYTKNKVCQSISIHGRLWSLSYQNTRFLAKGGGGGGGGLKLPKVYNESVKKNFKYKWTFSSINIVWTICTVQEYLKTSCKLSFMWCKMYVFKVILLL